MTMAQDGGKVVSLTHRPLFTPQEMLLVDLTRNVMAHAQKPELGFLRNGRVHLNRREGSVQSTTGSRGVRISGQRLYYL